MRPSRTVFKSRFAPQYPAQTRLPATPDALLEKAGRALVSADALFRGGDAEGSCNRSYYAMFNAARAALILVGAPSEATEAKSHSGLQAAFNQYLVKSGHIPQALGAEFRRAGRLRQIGDHLGDPIESEKAELTLNHASEFVQKVKSEFQSAIIRVVDNTIVEQDLHIALDSTHIAAHTARDLPDSLANNM